MAKNTTQYLTKSGKVTTTSVLNTGTLTTIFTAGAEGSKILGIYIVSSGGALVVFAANDGITNHTILNIAGAVNDTDVLDISGFPQKSGGSKYFNLEAGWTLKASSSGSTTVISVYAEDY